MSGLIGKKIGMTSIFDASGKNIPCTLIQAGPCVVTQVKTMEKDGYDAIQLAFDDKKEKNTTNALKGHFKKANTSPKRVLREFTRFEVGARKSHGEVIDVSVFLKENMLTFQVLVKERISRVVKRHNFGGVGDRSHGQHNRLRAPGSLGASSWPQE